MQKKLNNKGFSLVELIVVVAIMAILIGVLAPTLISNIEKSRESKDIQTLDAVASALQTAYADEKGNADASAYKTETIALTAVLSDAGKDGEAANAYADLVREYIGNRDIVQNCTCAERLDIYFTLTDEGTVTVFFSADATSPSAYETRHNNTLEVVR